MTGMTGAATINNATENEIVTVASTTTELDAEANLTFDGSTLEVGGIAKATTSIQTPLIEYTDGDDAMTIADGGKVTFAAGFAVGSDAEGDILYHNGTTYTRLAKGSDDHVLTMDGNVPNWEAAAGGGGRGGAC